MNVDALKAQLTKEQLECLISALEAQAILLKSSSGEFYAARRYADLGWWIWKLEYSSQEYFVDSTCTRCTCPAPNPCKHIVMLKHGSNWDIPPSKSARPRHQGGRRRR